MSVNLKIETRERPHQLKLNLQCIKRLSPFKMLEDLYVSCRVWRIWQRNISDDLEGHFLDVNHYHYYYLWTSIIILTVFGNLLLGVIWHYERFGGDSQKRSLQNQLASQIIIACLLILNNGNFSPLNLPQRFASYDLWLHLKLQRALYLILLDLIVLHTLVVYLQVVVWKRLRECNEELIIRATWITSYSGNLALSLLCPVEEKIQLYSYLIGGSRVPINSHVAEIPQIVAR